MIAVIADTHMPKGRRALPEECVARIPRPSMGLLHLTAAGLRFEHLWLG
jgi:hypothetical protein